MTDIDLLVTNAQIVSPEDGTVSPSTTAIAVKNGQILEIGLGEILAPKYKAAQQINAEGKFVFPGLINTHNHLFQVLTKGLGKERLLWEWLDSTISRMAPHITEEEIYIAALAGCMSSIRTGCTTTLDFQYLHSYPGHFEAVCQAFQDSGMRGYVGRVQYHNDYLGLSSVAAESCEEYFRAMTDIVSKMKNRSMLDAAVIVPIIINMLELPYYRSGYLRELRECSLQLGIPCTAHVVETADDDNYCLKRTGLPTLEFMEKEGFFSERCVLAHCVKMRETDFGIFKKHKVKVSYNPISNMILGSGIAPVKRFMEEGICVSVATDGPGSNDSMDMLETLKFASLLQKVQHQDARVLTALETLKMATIEGAKALCRDDIGKIETGKRADFFLYNPSSLRSAPVANPVTSLVFTSGESSVETVVVDGKILVEDGRYKVMDESLVIEKLEKAAASVRKKSESMLH